MEIETEQLACDWLLHTVAVQIISTNLGYNLRPNMFRAILSTQTPAQSLGLTLLVQAIAVLLETNIATGYISCLAWE